MVDVTFLSPQKNQCILTTHTEVLSRADRKTGVVSGNRVIPTDPVSLAVTVEAGRIRILGAPTNAAQSNVSLNAAHGSLARIDIIYRDTSGIPQVIAGTPDAIEDPKNLGDWKSYTAPTPPSTIPDGVILAAVWVPAAATTINSGNIWMFAGGVVNKNGCCSFCADDCKALATFAESGMVLVCTDMDGSCDNSIEEFLERLMVNKMIRESLRAANDDLTSFLVGHHSLK